jgi:hypothetical protein
VAEEIILYGLSGNSKSDRKVVPKDLIDELMEKPEPKGEVSAEDQKRELVTELAAIEAMRSELDKLAYKQAEELVMQHERYYQALSIKPSSGIKALHYKVVEPVIPMDVLGVYIFLPGAGREI